MEAFSRILAALNHIPARAARGAWALAASALVLFAAGPARAEPDEIAGVTDEVTLGTTTPSNSVPRASFIADSLRGAYGFGSTGFLLRLGGTWTRDGATAPPAGSTFGSQGGNVFSFFVGGSLRTSEKLLLTLDLEGSPKSTTLAPTTVQVAGPRGEPVDVDGQLSASSSALGASGSSRWRVLKSEHLETALVAAASVTAFSTTQQLAAAERRDGSTVTISQLADYCRTHTCGASLQSVLSAAPASVLQGRFALGAKETIHEDTDLALTAAYFAYDKDPTSAGYFGVTSFGRTSYRFGGGIAIAPVNWSIELDAVQRIKRLELTLVLQYARYVANEGYDLATAIKAEFKFTEKLAAWLSLSGQRDVDASNAILKTGSATLGGRLAF